jgi:hypothetical protein
MILAMQVLGCRHSKAQLGHTRFTIEQQGVRQAVGINHPTDLGYRLLIA